MSPSKSGTASPCHDDFDGFLSALVPLLAAPALVGRGFGLPQVHAGFLALGRIFLLDQFG
jgi:hypothetical protein